jgi:hypothetical protein
MPLIEIRDQTTVSTEHGRSTRPAVNLRDLLAVLPRDKLARNWSIMELWAVAEDDSTDVLSIEAGAASSPTGLQTTGAELLQLAQRLLQVIDAIVVAYDGAPPTRSDPDLRESAEIVIEAIDSTLWRVYAKDVLVIDRLRHAFTDVREVSPEVPIPATHDARSQEDD